MSAALSKKRAIALSYGTVVHPTPDTYHKPAHELGCRIINHLWNNWGEDNCGLRDGEIDLYSVNIPLIEELLSPDGLKIAWTRIWRNSYGRLFKQASGRTSNPPLLTAEVTSATPDQNLVASRLGPGKDDTGDLVFKWGPEMKGLITPQPDTLPIGTDGWAIYHGMVSVTPLRATFGEPHGDATPDPDTLLWKMKL